MGDRGHFTALSWAVRFTVVLCLVGCGFSTRIDTGARPDDAIGNEVVTDAAIDAPDTRPLAACPAPAANCTLMTAACLPTTSCYYRCTTNRNWEDARVRCEQDGMGCLVTVNDATENTCLATTLTPSVTANRYWIGFKQTTNTVEPDQGWTWTCPASTFTPSPPWGLPPPANEPNDAGGNEDCAAVVNDFGHWIDGDCATQFDYVCEFPR